MGEDVLECFIGGDAATYDFGEVVDAGAEVLAQEVATKARTESFLHTEDRVMGFGKCLIMAEAGHHDIVLHDAGDVCSLINGILQDIQMQVVLGADFNDGNITNGRVVRRADGRKWLEGSLAV